MHFRIENSFENIVFKSSVNHLMWFKKWSRSRRKITLIIKILPETTEIFECPTDNMPKHLILSYSFEIEQINERTNIYLKFYFKIMFLSHKNFVFIIKLKSKMFTNSLKSANNLTF